MRFRPDFGSTDALLREVKESMSSRHRLFAALIAGETDLAICEGDLFQHVMNESMPAGACGVSNERKMV